MDANSTQPCGIENLSQQNDNLSDETLLKIFQRDPERIKNLISMVNFIVLLFYVFDISHLSYIADSSSRVLSTNSSLNNEESALPPLPPPRKKKSKKAGPIEKHIKVLDFVYILRRPVHISLYNFFIYIITYYIGSASAVVQLFIPDGSNAAIQASGANQHTRE